MASDNTLLIEDKMDIVTYQILVDGNKVPKKYHVTNISIHQEINKIPTATLVLIDGEPSKEDFEISSSDEFLPGKKIEIELGYRNDNKTVFKGIIITNSHRVNNNCAELNIECKDETVKMTINKSNGHFKKQITCTEIAEELLKKYNINNSEIEDATLKHGQLMQANVTDWDFMIGRLDVAGMMCLIDNAQVIIKNIKKLLVEPYAKFTLVYGKNILEFNADLDSRTRSDSVKTWSWDFTTQKVVVKENDKTGVEEKDGQDSGSKPVKVTPEMDMRTSANMTEQELIAIATTKKLRQDLSKIKAKVKYLGTIKAVPGDFIELKGVGKNFTGNAFISAIQHEYTDGCWITEATLGWTEEFFSEQTNPNHAASSTGQPSTIQGLQIAIVTGIEDEEGQYRVLVRLPMVDDKESLYARMATLDAGDKRGTFFRPEIDDEVIVGFLNDDASNPVILGMLHSGAKTAPLEPESKNDKKGYVSRSGIKMIFDDGEKKLTVETPGSRVFELNDEAGTITLKDGDGNKIIMEQSGISIEAAKDLTLKAGTGISISAPKISIKADGTMEAEGGGSTSIKSGGVTEIKGSLVKIN
jgi:Rhs element Vgr protein